MRIALHRHGRWLVGEQINAKLTEGEFVEIRRHKSEGMTFSEIAATYGVSRQNIETIVDRQSWWNLP